MTLPTPIEIRIQRFIHKDLYVYRLVVKGQAVGQPHYYQRSVAQSIAETIGQSFAALGLRAHVIEEPK